MRSTRERPHDVRLSQMEFTGVTAIALRCSLTPPHTLSKETKMKLALIGAAAVAAAAFATPALAQAVIEDPGYCAQFYPDANCQNLGTGQSVHRWWFQAEREHYGVAPRDAVDRARAVPLSWRTEVQRLRSRARSSDRVAQRALTSRRSVCRKNRERSRERYR